MKTTATIHTTIPVEIYNELYDHLCDTIAENGECDEDGKCDYGFEFESEDGHYYINGEASAYFEYIDDSFDHAFGIEHCGHWEFDKLDDVIVEVCLYIDDDEDETEIEFDGEVFEHLHDETTIKRLGVVINQGDEVIAKPNWMRWSSAKFLYYDPINRYYYIEIDGKKRLTCKLLPATEKNRQLIGTY